MLRHMKEAENARIAGHVRSTPIAQVLPDLFAWMEETGGEAREEVLEIFEEYVSVARRLLMNQLRPGPKLLIIRF